MEKREVVRMVLGKNPVCVSYKFTRAVENIGKNFNTDDLEKEVDNHIVRVGWISDF